MSSLLAALLVASAIAPPAVRHTHELANEGSFHHAHRGDANTVRQNRDRDAARHHHVSSYDEHVAHSHPRQPEMGRVAWWHLHLHWFGLELTLPDPDCNPNDDEQRTDQKVLVSAASQDSEFCQVNRSSCGECCVWQVAPLALENVAALQAPLPTLPPVLCAPLCDSARHERSGVLLA